jgi:hypothetical protein
MRTLLSFQDTIQDVVLIRRYLPLPTPIPIHVPHFHPAIPPSFPCKLQYHITGSPKMQRERRAPIRTYMRPDITLTRRRRHSHRKRRIRMDPDCAICSQPALARCECESKGLDTAVRQAEQRMMASVFTEIRFVALVSYFLRLGVLFTSFCSRAVSQYTKAERRTHTHTITALGSAAMPKITSSPSLAP